MGFGEECVASFGEVCVASFGEVCVASFGKVCVASFLCCVFFVFVLCLGCSMFPVFLDCPFLIARSVFSSVYSKWNGKNTKKTNDKNKNLIICIWSA